MEGIMTTASAAKWERATTRYDLAASFPVDPYLVWAEISDWAGFARHPDKFDQLRVLLELSGNLEGCDDLSEQIKAIVESNALNLPDSHVASRYATASVTVGQLDSLTAAIKAGIVTRFQLGLARVWPSDAPGDADLRDFLPEERVRNIFGAQAEGRVFETLGVVDDGCCLAHEWFNETDRSGFLLLWEQSDKMPPIVPWKPPATPDEPARDPWLRFNGVSYGVELVKGRIDELREAYRLPCGEPAERLFYERAVQRDSWGREGRTHGAGVLHIIAGSALPADATRRFPLIFVQLPTDTVADASGGSLGVYLLDGARYIVQRTRLVADILSDVLKGRVDYRTTINVSLGSIAGPHDGSTITELALAELGRDAKVELVLAAGNTAGKHIHAARTVAMGSPGRFDILLTPDNPQESYVEVWLPANGTTVFADDFTVEVTAPDGQRSPPLIVGQALVLCGDGAVRASVVFARAVAQGRCGTMVLLAVRSSRPVDGRIDVGPYGFWSIQISTTLADPVKVHAWVERNDILIGRRTPQQTRFVDDGSGYLDDEYTLSSVANGENVVVVGAYRQRQREVTDYSANGPTLNGARRGRPDFYAPGDESTSLPGITVPGFFSGTWTRMSGTSVAAPLVARWLATDRPCDQECEVRTMDDRPVEGIKPEDDDAC
jgi:hypothetical protein